MSGMGRVSDVYPRIDMRLILMHPSGCEGVVCLSVLQKRKEE
jgi:hypothetical protein